MHFPINGRLLQAVTELSLQIDEGETLGLVGESGSGKSTTGPSILRLEPMATGSVLFEDKPVFNMNRQELKAFRKSAQMIFQDPYASLNPRMSAKELLAEPLDIHNLEKGKAREARLKELIELVGLSPHHLGGFFTNSKGGKGKDWALPEL